MQNNVGLRLAFLTLEGAHLVMGIPDLPCASYVAFDYRPMKPGTG